MTIKMRVFDERGHQIEILYLPEIPQRPGTYSLPLSGERETRSYFAAHLYGIDVGGLLYRINKSDDGFISIDTGNPSKCTIQGTFDLTFVDRQRKDMYPYPYADTLRFSEGRFHTHVVTWPGAR